MEVQRVRVVDSWAVKCGNGKYLDAHAVNVVVSFTIVFLVLLSLSWSAICALEFRVGLAEFELLRNDATQALILAGIALIVALLHLVPIAQMIRHGKHTVALIAVTSLLSIAASVGVAFQGFSDLSAMVGSVPVYIILGGLAILTRDYYL